MGTKLIKLTDKDGNAIIPAYGLLNGGVANVPSNGDFNNYTKVGVYCVTGNSGAATIANIPVKAAGRLFVVAGLSDDVEIKSSWDYLIQIYVAYNGSGIYLRDISTGSTASEINYGPWKSVNLTTI